MFNKFFTGMLIGFTGGVVVGAVIGGVGAYINYGSFATPEKLNVHFDNHGKEFKGLFSNSTEYACGAKYTIRHGTKVKYIYKGKETVGYVRFFGSAGKENYAFVGMNGSKAATFGIRSVASLIKELEITTFMI